MAKKIAAAIREWLKTPAAPKQPRRAAYPGNGSWGPGPGTGAAAIAICVLLAICVLHHAGFELGVRGGDRGRCFGCWLWLVLLGSGRRGLPQDQDGKEHVHISGISLPVTGP